MNVAFCWLIEFSPRWGNSARRAQRLPLGEAVAKIGSSEPILVTDEGKTGSEITDTVG